MATYVGILDTQLDPDAPLTSLLAYQWRDNPLAMFEGAAGAPRLQFDALASGFSAAGGLGSVAFLGRNVSPGIYASAGATTSGSNLEYAGVYNNAMGVVVGLSGVSPSGTWRCMGFMFNGAGAAADVATTWMRIA